MNPPELPDVTELEDGSAEVHLPEEAAPPQEADHFANLAATMPRIRLGTLAAELLELIEKDKKAREARDKQQEEGIRRTGLGDDAPGGAMFDGASKVVHPMLAEGCVDFSARAMKEIFPAKGPVKSVIRGDTERNVLDRAKRKVDYLNWQITTQIEEYRAEKEIELTQLPLGGSQYMKFWPEGGRIHCEFVPIDKVFLPYAATSFYTSPRATHEQEVTEHTFKGRVASGFYADIDALSATDPEKTASQEAADKVEGKEETGYNEDGVRTIYEVTAFYELEGGETLPYIFHVDLSSSIVLAIYRNWHPDDAKKAKLDWWQEDKFIPWRGAYGIGLLHLIGSLAGSATGALRALLDSAHINNAPTAVKLKGARASGQNIEVNPTEVQEIEAPAGVDDIRKVLMPMPFNAPSNVLFQLLDWITQQAKGVVATAEEKIADVSDRMPVGTALALIEQGSQVFSAIHSRLHAGQKKALDIICRLNRDYPDVESMSRFGVTPEDFKDNSDIDPVSDPNIFSEAQRYAQLQETMKLMQAFPDLKWQRYEMARRALALIRVEYADEVLPPIPQPVTNDPVTENFVAITQGAAIKAAPNQDHTAHLREHLSFLKDPLFGGNPLVDPQKLMGILQHIQDHMLQIYLAVAKTAAAVGAQMTGQGDETTMVNASDYARQQLQQMLPQDFLQQVQAVQAAIQQRMPKPPMDPAVQATYDAAMAEINRKAAVDKATDEREKGKIASTQQLEQMALESKERLAEQAQFFEGQLTLIREEGARQIAEFDARVKLMQNEQDNQQHHLTEVTKNIQDNITNLQIALEANAAKGAAPAEAPDLSPALDQLNGLLQRVEQQRSNDALGTIMTGLQSIIAEMGRPKRTQLTFDDQGRPNGTMQVPHDGTA